MATQTDAHQIKCKGLKTPRKKDHLSSLFVRLFFAGRCISTRKITGQISIAHGGRRSLCAPDLLNQHFFHIALHGGHAQLDVALLGFVLIELAL